MGYLEECKKKCNKDWKKINVEITNEEEVKKIYEKNGWKKYFKNDLFDLENAEFEINKYGEIWVDFEKSCRNMMIYEIDEKDLSNKKEIEFVYGEKWDEVKIEWKLKFNNEFLGYKGE